ncbi:hypothetical protein [Streptomyces spectabilis]|uniref:DUF5709 domain-containing protein n=1 Tax=Streptomyces spectabilis TaxID=68270 RepID=A0A5P2XFJ4_STRST|nr:hypothetical protein [Streptomyces spectabilis]MBB5104705.1 hypothetical protein [Streptomyces spectabilis]MCI3904942.1 hypothetical protein [Streptomyces spectabilis]QEV61975.1 hypothetical protein CP982_27415 [Streptomyces spectabilis]GGV01694.1 hypothetical protein GCM10010245_05630 [Streptomyces spectabilis]
MSVDPTDPDTFEVEETAGDLDEETPEADAAEQHTELAPQHDGSLEDVDPGAANVADVAEQARVVDLDEDDYR